MFLLVPGVHECCENADFWEKRGGECAVIIFTIRILEILVMLTMWEELPTHKDGTVEVRG
jgi:hypothetical protein